MKALVIIICVIIAIVVIVHLIKNKLKDKQETITCYTGGLGSGKTFLMLLFALLRYGKNLAKYKFAWLRFHFVNLFRKKKNKKKWTHKPPIFLSNIPVGIKKKKRKWIMCHELKIEHLLLQEAIPLGSVVCIDEIGSVASQYDFGRHNVKNVLDEFFRLFRHYVSNPKLKIQSYLYVNDQCSENIVLVVRRRINTIHNLSNFKLLNFGLFKIALYFERQMNISEEIKTIDMKQDTNEGDTQDNSNLTIRFMFRTPKYDTYCYHDRYKRVPKKKIKRFKSYQKDELMRCPIDINYEALTSKKNEKKGEES